MPLQDVRGHRRILDLLASAVSRRALPPALLFEGPEGVGKRLTAVAVAQALNCVTDVKGCGACSSCRRIARGAHPDVVLVEPGETGTIKIDTIREDVIQQSAYRPFEGRARVFVIDEADAMVDNAQDALLKTLEEPPPGSVFILVTSRAESLLPTVRSRCYRLRFGRVPENEIARLLRERHGFTEKGARAASATADGSVGRALSSEAEEALGTRDAARQLLQVVAAGRVPHRLQAAKAFIAGPRTSPADRGVLGDRLLALSSLVRDLGVLATRADRGWLANADLAPQLETLAPAFDGDRVVRAFSAVDRAVSALERNASSKVVADWLALEI